MSQEANIAKMEAGREASFISSHVKPYVMARIDVIMEQMVGYYRSGTMPHDLLVGKVGEITALLDMISNLESAERQGDYAAQQEIGNAEA